MPDWAEAAPDEGKQKKKRRQRKKKKGKRDNNGQTDVSRDNKSQGSDVTKQGSHVLKQGSDMTKQGSDMTKQGSDMTKQGSDVTKQGSDVLKKGSGVTNQGSGVTCQDKDEAPKKQRSRRRFDRYFGRFQCRICRKSWDSAFVFTRAGTRKVVFKQRCKMCEGEGAWVYPYRLELLRCSICQSDPCECQCDDCGKYKHTRYIPSMDSKGNTTREADPQFEYCDCERQNKAWIGGNIDAKKPHRADLCQKCVSGFPCTSPKADEDNEP